MNKKANFALMNVLIKGSAAAIQAALQKLDSDLFELKTFTYDPKNLTDPAIVKTGLVFKNVYEGFVTPDEIPFANMPEIKFIGLGNGIDGSRSDGCYVFYKDFKETSISECYKFTGISPFKEEFDAQEDVVDKVKNSFMDHTWQYRYEDYSCGEYCPWAFNRKKDKALIAKWKSDEKDNSKEETKNITIGGMGDIAFKYEHIDGVSPEFYEGVYNGKEFNISADETVTVDIDGTAFVITAKTQKKVASLLKKFKKAFEGKDVGRPLYNPVDVVAGKYELSGVDEYGKDTYTVSDNADQLVPVQIAHRAALFAKVNNLLSDEKVAEIIIKAAPKKKNGTFALKRVTQIASLFCMEDDASMYVLCAVAKKDTELLIDVRQIASIDMEKTYADVISISHLFKN